MKTRFPILLVSALFALSPTTQAFPPAPSHEIYGTVRDENGRPLDRAEGTIILNGLSNEITRGPSDPSIGNGVNYRLNVPMDANIISGLYQVSALRPALPFTVRVLIRNVSYVPIQMTAGAWAMGVAGGRTRLDLTLGVDSDGDGIPDAWEQALIDSDYTGKLSGLGDVRANDDLDGDGLSNLQEYLIGTYAMDAADGLTLEIVSVANGQAHLRFTAVNGRTYTIKSSNDLKSWSQASYATSPTGTVTPSTRATETTVFDAYVPTGAASAMQFRLYVE
ncbi:MAG: hypothetical protein ACOYMN_24095 [Roseimicrobium sp.]